MTASGGLECGRIVLGAGLVDRVGIRWTASRARRSRRPFVAFVPAFFVVLLAQCVPDYLGTPRTPAFSFQVLPETAWVAVGDTVPSPFRCALTVDGSPVPCGIRLASDRAYEFIQVEPDGTVRALRRGLTPLSASPVSLLGTPETVRRDVLLRTFYAGLAVGPLCADTARSLGDTLFLSAQPRTRRNGALFGLTAAAIWRTLTNQGVVAVLDSGFASQWGVVRSEANGAATMQAVVDSGVAECQVIVAQRPQYIGVPAPVTLSGPGATAVLAATPRDARGRLVEHVADLVRWQSLDADVATVNGVTGLVTGVAPGTTWVVATLGALTDMVFVRVGTGP